MFQSLVGSHYADIICVIVISHLSKLLPVWRLSIVLRDIGC